MRTLGVSFLVAFAVLAILDALWLGVISRDFYKTRLSHLLAEKPIWAIAVLFYIVHTAGIAVFAVPLSLQAGTWTAALLYGGFFGFCCYAAYDFTNHATMRDWPASVTAIDLAWGTFVSAAATVAAFAAVKS